MSDVLTVRPTGLLRYERCRYSYHLSVNLKIGTAETSHSTVFGKAGHKAVLGYVAAHAEGGGLDPVPIFLRAFEEQLDTNIVSFTRHDAKELKEIGTKLCQAFPAKWDASGLIAVKARGRVMVENRIRFHLSKDIVLSAEPDVVARRKDGPEHELEIPDVKFPASAAFLGFAKVSDQLTAYQLAVAVDAPSQGLGDVIVKGVGFLEGLKKKDAEWHMQMVPAHSRDRLGEYVSKVKANVALIRRGYFQKRTGEAWDTPCAMCDFRNLCIDGDATGLSSPLGDVLELVNAPMTVQVQSVSQQAA